MQASALVPGLNWLGNGAALMSVIALVFLAGAAARRGGVARTAPDAGGLRLRARLALDARRRLHLVDTPGGAVLVLTGGGQDRILALPPEPARQGGG
jgi:hypothetical protein